MKKRLWIPLLILAIILIAILFLFRKKATAPTTSPTQPSNNSQIQNVPAANAKYIDYDEGAIAGNPGNKVLFFHAKWCPQCRQIESDIMAGPLPEGWTIIKVDYDKSQDLRQKYGVTLQTTLVKVDDQGNSLGKFVAYDEPKLTAIKQNFLDK